MFLGPRRSKISSSPHLVLRFYAHLELNLPDPNPHFLLTKKLDISAQIYSWQHQRTDANHIRSVLLEATTHRGRPIHLNNSETKLSVEYFYHCSNYLLSSNRLFACLIPFRKVFLNSGTVCSHPGLPRRLPRIYEILTKCWSNSE